MSETVEQSSDLKAAEPDEATAFAHVLAFARKVAHELEAARVPRDEWLAQEYRPAHSAEQFGWHQLGESVRVPTMERREPIDGWRVFGTPVEERYVADGRGERVGPEVGRRVRELWLLHTGELRDVMLTTDASGATTAERTELDRGAVGDLVREPEWTEDVTRVHGQLHVHRYRTDGDLVHTDPVPALSGLITALRTRVHEAR
ncbi:hypothetical protein EXU48_11865 [Occultella glacieicola]|uniref:Uncharacterized protein n=1 Tax=Occultella glacieicola TaxID=2518684 RepID=A0ABY2E3D3_9MICO|nr:hypothetical protein [Occultella glacieicola]TDE94134.1 hypothetical protein EXU48_11865 [Occultella glacieicola]